jgi:hypothetical protein
LEFAATGGSEVTSYRLDWDDSSDELVWHTIAGHDTTYPYLQTEFTKTLTTPGRYYKFRLQVENRQGWSLWSDPIAIQASYVPEKPEQPVVEIESQASTRVRILWTEPSIRGTPITAYEVQLKTKAGDFSEFKSLCDGTTEAANKDHECLFEMLLLQKAPMNLVEGD